MVSGFRRRDLPIRVLWFCLLVLPGPAALPVRAESPPAVPVEGEPFGAELAAVDAKWEITFNAGGKPRTLPAAELVQWGTCGETPRGPILVMADGGWLVAEVWRADTESLTADSDLFGTRKLPLDRLAGVVFDPPGNRRRRDLLLDRVARATGQSDRLVLHNGDELTGLIEAIEDDVVKLETDVAGLEIETHRIAALVFNPSLKQTAPGVDLRAWAGFGGGSRLLATQLVLDESSLQITTAGGQTWKTSPSGIVCLQPLGGRVTYLSDRKPAGYRHVPFLDLPWPYQADRNVTGGRLRCGGRLYLKGLGMHSAARLTYTLGEPYRRFQAELGVDDSTGGGGSVRFRVFVDGRQKYTSETIRGGAAPLPVSIDISGVERLDLVVDYAERGDELDHADWLGARLVR